MLAVRRESNYLLVVYAVSSPRKQPAIPRLGNPWGRENTQHIRVCYQYTAGAAAVCPRMVSTRRESKQQLIVFVIRAPRNQTTLLCGDIVLATTHPATNRSRGRVRNE